MDIIGPTLTAIRVTIQVAIYIQDSKNFNQELKKIAMRIINDLLTVQVYLDQLKRLGNRITAQDEMDLRTHMKSLNTAVSETKVVLEEVSRDRNFLQQLLVDRVEMRQKILDINTYLNNICQRIQGAIQIVRTVSIPSRDFPDFRKTFRNVPEKTLAFYDFSIVRNTPTTILTIALEEFDPMQHLFYLKVGNDQFFISYQLRTWSALNPKLLVLAQRKRDFLKRLRKKNSANLSGSNSSLDSISSTNSTTSSLPLAAPNNSHETVDFSEFFMSHDKICGMALTQSLIYVATKFEITIVSLSKQCLIAQYGTEGDEPKTFKEISFIYIPPNDKTSLYIVDRGQSAVHKYQIDDTGDLFKYVRQYVVIANVSEKCNLISCAIYYGNLFVTDDANNCLHIFSLKGEHQSSYLRDNTMTPFAPGSICAHGNYLYVANCSTERPGILVFNEECQPVDWFRNPMLKEILAIDIDPDINELYILTTQYSENDKQKKQPLIVSMDLLTRSQ
jgi:hypothetical protein